MRDPDKAFVRIKDGLERYIGYYGLRCILYHYTKKETPLNDKKATLQVAFNVVENIEFDIASMASFKRRF